MSSLSKALKKPKNSVIEFTECRSKQHRRYLRRFYVVQVTLSVCGTSVCVDATAVTSYVHFNSLRGFTLLAVTNEI